MVGRHRQHRTVWIFVLLLLMGASVWVVSVGRVAAEHGPERVRDAAPSEYGLDSADSSSVNTECATAAPMAGEGTFPFDLSGPVTWDLPTGACSPYDGHLSDVWYCWTSSCTGDVTVDTCGQTLVDTKIEAYDGCDCAGGPINSLRCDDDACVYQSRLSFSAAAGQSYLIRLGVSPKDLVSGGLGTFTIDCSPDPVLPCAVPGEHCQPPRESRDGGGRSHRVADDFVVAPDEGAVDPYAPREVSEICWWGGYSNGVGDCTQEFSHAFEVRYYLDDGGIPGALLAGPFSQVEGTLAVTGPVRTDRWLADEVFEYEYHGTHAVVSIIPGECHWIEITDPSSAGCAWLWRSASPHNRHAVQDAAMDGYDSTDVVLGDHAFCLDVPIYPVSPCVQGPPNDDCSSAIPISDGGTPVRTLGATTDGPGEGPRAEGETLCVFPGGDHQVRADIWYEYTSTCSGMLAVELADSTFDAKLALYDGTDCPTSLSAVACAGPTLGSSRSPGPQLSVAVAGGQTFKIRVGGAGAVQAYRSKCLSTRFGGIECDDPNCKAQVVAALPNCQTGPWNAACAAKAGELCYGATGTAVLRVRCGDAPVGDSCADAIVEHLPFAFLGDNTGATNDCELLPGDHTWVAFELCERGSVTVDYCGSSTVFADARPYLAQGCPCDRLTQAGRRGVCPDGNPTITWDCLPPGTYYYPVSSEPGSQGAYTISVAAGDCGNPCDQMTGDCCSADTTAGCGDASCCASVCALDSYCCDSVWDAYCAREAVSVCAQCSWGVCDFATGDCFTAHSGAGCGDPATCEDVCACDPYCCEGEWDALCADLGIRPGCGASADCNANAIIDAADIASASSDDCDGDGVPDECEPDCNGNLVADDCDIAGCVSVDCNENGIPDECEPDCNANLVADECDISSGFSSDCNRNGVPDACDLSDGSSVDCNVNAVPDECDIAGGGSRDCDSDARPDECQDTSTDCNGNSVWDACDIADATSVDVNHNSIPDDCELNRVFYVDDDAAGDPAPGDPDMSDPLEDGSVFHPFDAIQEAIGSAIHGDDIEVSDGVYVGLGNCDLDYVGKAITIRSANGPTSTTIDCQGLAGGVQFVSGESADSVLDGFRIVNGNRIRGGAVLCDGASPVITRCILEGNVATSCGGAIACLRGGAQIYGTSIRSNTAQFGGGVYAHQAPLLAIHNSLIAENSATDSSGGAMYLSNSDTLLRGSTITSNSAQDVSGGIRTYRGRVSISSSIVWGNARSNLSGDAKIVAEYSDIQGGHMGLWNLDVDPLFVDVSTGDYHLDVGSPCINAANPVRVSAANRTDVDGEDRVQQCRSDMGADETPYYIDCDTSGSADACDISSGLVPDCNKNGVPDGCDIAVGASSDCQGNGIPDECDGVEESVSVDSGMLDINAASEPTYLMRRPPPATGDVTLSLSARGNFEHASNYLTIDINGIEIGDAFVTGAGNCSTPPDAIELRVTAMDFNKVVAGADALITIDPSQYVSAYTCDGEAFAAVQITFDAIRLADCNVNGIPDECDLALESTDCNENGRPDECDGVVGAFQVETARLGPIGGNTLDELFTNLPVAVDEVVLSFAAYGDFEYTNEYVDVAFGEVDVGRIYDAWSGRRCANPPVEAELTLPAEDFNAVASSGDATLSFTTPSTVYAGDCSGTSYITATLSYPAIITDDCNANGFLDECDLTLGVGHDCNVNNALDECEAGRLGDFNADGSVDVNDFPALSGCIYGPGVTPEPALPICTLMCLTAFDTEGDGDNDLRDFAAFQAAFGAPPS